MKRPKKPLGDESNGNELSSTASRFFFKYSLGADQIAREILKENLERKLKKQ
jgi:hypothetical protein